MPTFTVACARRGSKSRLISMDGEPWRSAPREVIARLGLDDDFEANVLDLEASIADVEPLCARERALRLLTYRERSLAELRHRLMDDGFLPEVTERVLDDLTRSGLVDDERFAHALARTLTTVRGLGSRRVEQELTSAGIGPELASAAMAEAADGPSELERAARLARSYAARRDATLDKVAARLARRGFPVRVALAVAREAVSDAQDTASRDDEWSDED